MRFVYLLVHRQADTVHRPWQFYHLKIAFEKDG